MAKIILPPVNIHHSDTLNWFEVYKPTFEQNLALNYLTGGQVRTFTAGISNLASTDGEVPFLPVVGVENNTTVSDTLYVVSSSASDTFLLYIAGIDVNGDEKLATATLTGTTSVSIGDGWAHVNLFAGYENADTTNIGTVYLSTETTGIPTAGVDKIPCVMIPSHFAGVNPRQCCPNGFVYIMPSITITMDKADGATVRVYKGFDIEPPIGVVRYKQYEFNMYQNAFQHTFAAPVVLQPGEYWEITIQRVNAGSVVLSSYVADFMLVEINPAETVGTNAFPQG